MRITDRIEKLLKEDIPPHLAIQIGKVLDRQHFNSRSAANSSGSYSVSEVAVSNDSRIPPYVVSVDAIKMLLYQESRRGEDLDGLELSRINSYFARQTLSSLEGRTGDFEFLRFRVSEIYHEGYRAVQRSLLYDYEGGSQIFLLSPNGGTDLAKQWESVLGEVGAITIFERMSRELLLQAELIEPVSPYYRRSL